MTVRLNMGSSRRGRRPAIAALMLAGLLAGCQPLASTDASLVPEPRRKLAIAKPQSKKTATIPLPETALLHPPLAPTGCESRGPADPAMPPSAKLRQGELVPAQAKQDDNLATAIRLEYERECFKQSEARVRDQLVKLQTSVRRTMAAVGR